MSLRIEKERQRLGKDIIAKSKTVAELMKSLGHETRIRVLCQLLSGPKSVNQLLQDCEASQSGMSQFLKRMKDEGLLESKREGHFVFYEMTDTRLFQLMKSLKEIYCT